MCVFRLDPQLKIQGLGADTHPQHRAANPIINRAVNLLARVLTEEGDADAKRITTQKVWAALYTLALDLKWMEGERPPMRFAGANAFQSKAALALLQERCQPGGAVYLAFAEHRHPGACCTCFGPSTPTAAQLLASGAKPASSEEEEGEVVYNPLPSTRHLSARELDNSGRGLYASTRGIGASPGSLSREDSDAGEAAYTAH